MPCRNTLRGQELVVLGWCAWLAGTLCSGSASGQPARRVDPRGSAQRLTLTTKDGVELHCRYYPSAAGESAAPIILIHGWNEKGSQLSGLAKYLNSGPGGNFAVVVPDLRGHGGSTRQLVQSNASANAKPTERALSADKFRRADFQAIVTFDLEAVKKFLIEEHNQRRVNIDMLSLVGTEMGALAAMYWAARDWDWPPIRGLRQGQDVKALVLVSPSNSFKGASVQTPLKHNALRSNVAIQLIYGRTGSGASTTARRIASIVDKNRSEDIPFRDTAVNTTLQGMDLLTEDQLRVESQIARFLKLTILDRRDQFPWQPRGTNLSEK